MSKRRGWRVEWSMDSDGYRWGLRVAILLFLYSAATDETSLPPRVIVVSHSKTKGILLLNAKNYMFKGSF